MDKQGWQSRDGRSALALHLQQVVHHGNLSCFMLMQEICRNQERRAKKELEDADHSGKLGLNEQALFDWADGLLQHLADEGNEIHSRTLCLCFGVTMRMGDWRANSKNIQ